MFDPSSEPGPGLATALDPLVCGDLTDYAVVDAIVAWDRMIAWATARQAEVVAELAHRRCLVGVHQGQRSPRRDDVDEFAADELAVHLRLTRRAAESRLGFALALERLPGTAAALRAGRIDPWRAMVIADSVAVLPDVEARTVEDRVLPRAGEQTSGQLRRSCARAVVRTDPQAADRRCRAAYRERAAVLTPLPDGMAELAVRLRADTAVAVWSALDSFARRPAPGGAAADERGMDARRADALADLVLGRAVPAGLDVPRLRLLLGAAAGARPDDPVELAGYGPLPPVLARELAAAGPRAVVTVTLDPIPPRGGESTYRPSPALDRYVRTRDGCCQFPPCRQPAHRGDLDHIIPFPLGPTTAENLTALCRRHHRLKQRHGWGLARGPDGTLTWTTPSGHRIPTRPD